MTFQEALEYLNLPAGCSRQLVRKRYLELKKDYLKAINNAPSDHFSTLYRENLDKIEEAYNLLIETSADLADPESHIKKSIEEVGHMVDSILGKERQLSVTDRQKIEQYIDQINEIQSELLAGLPNDQPASITPPSERWDMKPGSSLKNDHESDATEVEESNLSGEEKSAENPATGTGQSGESFKGWRWEPSVLSKEENQAEMDHPEITDESVRIEETTVQLLGTSALIEKWIINLVLQTSFASNASSRRTLYNQVVSVAILLILVLIMAGAVYLLFPLF